MPKSEKVVRPAEGVEFPKDDKGDRPTMGINKKAFANALRAVNVEEAQKLDALEDRKWRRAYQKNVVEHVRHSAKSPEDALAVAKGGLDYLHKTMVFVRPAGADDSAVSLEDAMKKFTDKKFQTHEIKGSGSRAGTYSVQYKPYGTPGPLKDLSGDALQKQLDTWVKNGTIEMSCGSAISKVADNPDWCDLSDTYWVLFGATSAMGPFYKLMDLGANVIAVDLDRPAIWEKLIKETRSRAGRLIFPVKEAVPSGASDEDIAKVAGCNLLTDTPEIRTWLQDLYPKERLMCVALAYLDGALFVKVSMAMDAIIQSLIEKRGADKMGLGYLCTPTDAHLCTPSSVEAAKANLRRAPAWCGMLAPLLGMAGMPVKKNVEKPILGKNGEEMEGLHVIDCIIPEQGPNYILAKRLQHWRAMLSREKGCVVSSNVAPSTATASVLSNVLFALGYKGMSSFKPMEITYQETSNAVMAALMIRDVRDPTSAANPATKLKNPLCLFTENSFHGGCWRTGFKFSSLGAPAFISYLCSAFLVAPYLLFYSLYQAVGWGLALPVIFAHLGGDSASLWAAVGERITFFQWLGALEVLHAAVGITSSSPGMTLMQQFSRWAVVAALNVCSASTVKEDSFWVPMMLTAWCLAEVNRYVFYVAGQLRGIATSSKSVAIAMKMMKAPPMEKADDYAFSMPYPLVWLRYSLFIPLYPLGVSGELAVFWKTIGCALGAEALSVAEDSLSTWLLRTMKLAVGGMSTGKVLGVIGVAYAFGLPALYSMMLGSRKKQLGGQKKPSRDKKNQ